jgi:hypothetical protein
LLVTLRLVASGMALQRFLLFAWNPLVVFEWVGHAHNDSMLVFWLLLAVYGLLHRLNLLSMVSFMLGVLVKFTPLVVLPLFGVALTRWRQNGWRWRMLTVARDAVLAALLALALYLPFGIEAVRANFSNVRERSGLFANSFPSAVYVIWTNAGADPDLVAQVSTLVAGVILLAVVGWQVGSLLRQRAEGGIAFRDAFLTACTRVVFALLLLTFWFYPWYITWLFAFVTFISKTPWITRLLLLTFCGFVIHWLDFFQLWITHPLRLNLISATVTFGPVLVLIALAALSRSPRQASGVPSPA